MTLSEYKIKNLEKLLLELKHPKLRKLLKRAIVSWKNGVKVSKTYGVTLFATEKVEQGRDLLGKEGCCLLGAAALGIKKLKHVSGSPFIYREIWTISGITKVEYFEIINLFDQGFPVRNTDPLLTEEMLKIRKIIFS